jgi:hypothetical protein
VTTTRQARVPLLVPYVSYISTAFYFIFELWRLGSNVCGLRWPYSTTMLGMSCLLVMHDVTPFRILLMCLLLLIINLCYIKVLLSVVRYLNFCAFRVGIKLTGVGGGGVAMRN